MPAAEHPIDEALARALLRDQHPDLAELPLTLLGSGWDNVMFRLGGALTATAGAGPTSLVREMGLRTLANVSAEPLDSF